MDIRISGIAAWAALIGFLILAYWLLVASDIAVIEETEQDYIQRLALLARLEALPEEEEAIRDQLDQLSIEASERFLFRGNETVIQSEMQLQLRRLGARAAINIQSMRPMALPRQTAPLGASAVEVNFVTNFELLVDFLHLLEANEPLLKVRDLSVSIRRQSTVSEPAELAVSMQVRGLRQIFERKQS